MSVFQPRRSFTQVDHVRYRRHKEDIRTMRITMRRVRQAVACIAGAVAVSAIVVGTAHANPLDDIEDALHIDVTPAQPNPPGHLFHN
jgi:CHAD domain-containing protein